MKTDGDSDLPGEVTGAGRAELGYGAPLCPSAGRASPLG